MVVLLYALLCENGVNGHSTPDMNNFVKSINSLFVSQKETNNELKPNIDVRVWAEKIIKKQGFITSIDFMQTKYSSYRVAITNDSHIIRGVVANICDDLFGHNSWYITNDLVIWFNEEEQILTFKLSY